MDASVTSSALCKQSQAIFMQEMLSNFAGNPFPSDHYNDIRSEAISTALKEEQNCENALVAREEQSNKINHLSDEIDIELVELARNLLTKKEMLTSNLHAIRSVLSTGNLTAEQLNAKKDRVKPLELKRIYVQQLLNDCERIKRGDGAY
ncbi:hypothetical protein GCK32_005915 [Trichostrongylus colubriformis]|uniref:Uncharacterized protein n=1 Tax=Trichostrongylus colubriformis TaxID=6319 RepID=A0AAN8G454_TRICO